MVAGAVVLILVLQLLLGGLKWGRWVYAVGSNPDAARQAALPVERVILAAFVASGALAGLAGFLFLSRFGTITVNAGNGLELQSVAAAVVGGVNIFGGSGTLFGALLGALLINLLDLSLLRVPGLSEFWRDAVLGALILTAVTVDFLLGKRIGRLSTRARGRPAAGVPPPAQGVARMLDKALRWRWELFLAVVLVAVFCVNVSLSEFYLGEQNFVNMFQLSIEKLIVVVDHDVRHHQRRDRPLGRVGDGVQRLRARGAPRGRLGPVRAGGRDRAARGDARRRASRARSSPSWACRRWSSRWPA